MFTALPWPATSLVLARRRLPLTIAVALHAALLLALVNSLQPQTIDVVTPREVRVSLISQRAEVRAEVRDERQTEPRTTAAPVPPERPTPGISPAPPPSPAPALPVQRVMVPDSPAPAMPATFPAPVAVPAPSALAPTPAPTPAIDAKALPVPVTVPPHPPTPLAAATAHAPMTVSSVEYLHAPKPDYPLSAKRAGEQGKVLLRVLVNEKGQPERADIRESTGYPRLDDAARQAVLRASFKPHLEDDRPVPVYVLVPVSFNLR